MTIPAVSINFLDLHTKLSVLQDILWQKDKTRGDKLTPVLELLELLHSELPKMQRMPDMSEAQFKANEVNEVLKVAGEFLTMAMPKDCPYSLILSPANMPGVLMYLTSENEGELIAKMKDFIINREKRTILQLS